MNATVPTLHLTGRGEDLATFITASPAMKALQQTAASVADSDISILIRGESGVGKEVLARYIHDQSNRRHQAFIRVNCAALPETLLESELFGYEQGAFTGADSPRPGKFELANDGTILLDEIAEMRVSLQAKLLHVLQDGVFSRLGGRKEIRSDVRVLSATNRNLEKEIERGNFREDLYFRLKVIDLYVPPLRQRSEDILLLIEHFLDQYTDRYSRPRPDLSDSFRDLLLRHPWHGNVRELANLLKGIVILGDLDWAVAQLTGNSGNVVVPPVIEQRVEAEPPRPSLKEVSRMAAEAAEKELIVETLDETRWNRRRAAALLQVSYKTLLSKMKRFGLSDS